MSDKLSMPAVDKVQIKVQIKVPTFVRLQTMSANGHISMNALCSALLDEATAGVELTMQDVARINQIIAENVAHREQEKAKKGIK